MWSSGCVKVWNTILAIPCHCAIPWPTQSHTYLPPVLPLRIVCWMWSVFWMCSVKVLTKQNTILLGQLIDVLVCVCVSALCLYLHQIYAWTENFWNVYMMWFRNIWRLFCEWTSRPKDLLGIAMVHTYTLTHEHTFDGNSFKFIAKQQNASTYFINEWQIFR